MEETVIVIMLKESESGFLGKELGSYKISNYEELLYNTFAFEADGRMQVAMKITTDRDVEDWEFEAIYDYYDTETILPFVTSIQEEEDCFNPTWQVTFDFLDEEEAMEEKMQQILAAHHEELYSVYEAISDKRDEYR